MSTTCVSACKNANMHQVCVSVQEISDARLVLDRKESDSDCAKRSPAVIVVDVTATAAAAAASALGVLSCA